MRKKIGPFISGIGAGLCLAVVILSLWGLFNPDQESVQVGDLEGDALLASVESADAALTTVGAGATDAIDSDSQDGTDFTDSSILATTEGDDAEIPEVTQGVAKIVTIKYGMSARQIAGLLEQEGVIDNAQDFHDLVVTQMMTQRFIAGTFSVRTDATYEELIRILTSHPNI
ncbi:MAG: endolytic transglycosylase MltG [Peptococcaceae bacterium]|nr:endolytic transglycosylase MltG [Peptococcaceae bacterium]